MNRFVVRTTLGYYIGVDRAIAQFVPHLEGARMLSASMSKSIATRLRRRGFIEVAIVQVDKSDPADPRTADPPVV